LQGSDIKQVRAASKLVLRSWFPFNHPL